MFYAQSENKYIQEGTAFELGGVKYPACWLNESTPTQKAQIDLVEVVATNSPADERFYWVSSTLNGAELTYVNMPKELRPLQDQYELVVKQQVYSMLQPTDYIDIRNLRDPNYKLDWMLWRETVRTKSAEVILDIKKCANVDALAAIVTQIAWPKDPDYVEPTVEVTEGI